MAYTQRTNATAIPESMLDFFMSKIVIVGGVFDLSGGHLQVVQQSVPDMTVKVSVGSAFLLKSGQAKVYPVYLDATTNVTIDANSAGSTRYDAIVCYLNLGLTSNAEATNVIQFVAVKGVAGGSVPSNADIETAIGASNPYIRLANVEVINGATSIPTAKITDARNEVLYSPLITPITSTKFLPDGVMTNGKIVPSVASNNLTLALKTMAGTDASTTNPIYVRINGTVRTITGALSVTVNAGANSFNAGSAELATKAIDYFVYLAYEDDSNAVRIGFSRIPYARLYSDFSATATNEKYGAFDDAPDATNSVVVIGRFEATLSAGAGYTWTVPTFTSINLINEPIYETRRLAWTPANLSGGNVPTTTTNTGNYKVIGELLETYGNWAGTANGSNFTYARTTSMPFVSVSAYTTTLPGGVTITDDTTFDDHMMVYQFTSGNLASVSILPSATRKPTRISFNAINRLI